MEAVFQVFQDLHVAAHGRAMDAKPPSNLGFMTTAEVDVGQFSHHESQPH